MNSYALSKIYISDSEKQQVVKEVRHFKKTLDKCNESELRIIGSKVAEAVPHVRLRVEKLVKITESVVQERNKLEEENNKLKQVIKDLQKKR